MKTLAILLSLLLANQAFADDRGDRNGVRSEYDELMKSAGKWDFISNVSYITAILAASASYYCYNRSVFYKDIAKKRELSAHEANEYKRWQDFANVAGYSGAVFLGMGVMGGFMELHYENRAHTFGLDMSVKF